MTFRVDPPDPPVGGGGGIPDGREQLAGIEYGVRSKE